MKHSFLTKIRKPLVLVLILLLIASLAGCWKKDDSGSTEDNQDPIPSESTGTTTEPPVIPTETSAPPTTEAPTTPTTEPPTQPPETEPVQESDKGTVTAKTLNIRSGAGSNYEKVGSYKKGDEIEILETKGGWGRTSKGWVSMNYVKTDGSSDSKQEDDTDSKTTSDEVVSDGKTTALGHGVVNLGSLNVRSGPGTNYEKVGTVSKGARYAYYQRSGNWARIKDGWVSVSYFYLEGSTADGAGTGTVTGAGLNIRSGPGTGFDKVGALKQGETVKILAQVNGWGYTSKGWVSMSYVKMEGSTAVSTGTVTADKLNIRKEASAESAKQGYYIKGDKVQLLETKDNWGRTSHGWISLDHVKLDSSTATNTTYKTGKGTITASSLHIRKSADKTAESLGAYFKGDKVEILEVKNTKWGRTDKGWISLDYVKMD